MGYRNEVAFVVTFEDKEGKDKFVSTLPEGVYATVQAIAEETDDSIRYHDDYVKWYDEYPDVAACETLLKEAEQAEDLYRITDGTEGVTNTGIFLRLGEDIDDAEERYWEGDGALHSPFDLLRFSRSIDILW